MDVLLIQSLGTSLLLKLTNTIVKRFHFCVPASSVQTSLEYASDLYFLQEPEDEHDVDMLHHSAACHAPGNIFAPVDVCTCPACFVGLLHTLFQTFLRWSCLVEDVPQNLEALFKRRTCAVLFCVAIVMSSLISSTTCLQVSVQKSQVSFFSRKSFIILLHLSVECDITQLLSAHRILHG